VGGPIQSAKIVKPKLVILFINKFDLFSNAAPTDSTAVEKFHILREVFKEHIELVQKASKEQNVPFECLVGSAAQRWETRTILERINVSLYAKHG